MQVKFEVSNKLEEVLQACMFINSVSNISFYAMDNKLVEVDKEDFQNIFYEIENQCDKMIKIIREII